MVFSAVLTLSGDAITLSGDFVGGPLGFSGDGDLSGCFTGLFTGLLLGALIGEGRRAEDFSGALCPGDFEVDFDGCF